LQSIAQRIYNYYVTAASHFRKNAYLCAQEKFRANEGRAKLA